MEWTPDRIRAMADAMERRLGRPLVEVTPATLRLVIEALRFFAVNAFHDRHEGFTVEVSDARRGTIGLRIGSVADLEAARLLLDWAIAKWPRANVYVRKGGWVVHAYRAEPPIPLAREDGTGSVSGVAADPSCAGDDGRGG